MLTYQAAGVDVAQGDRFVDRLKHLARRPGHADLPRAAGGYAAVLPMTADTWLAMTTDGVGTKVLLAHRFNRHREIGIDLVAMCANDLVCVGARPTAFLDYYATGRLDLDQGLALIEGIAAGCDAAGMLLVGGETAEMPDVYEGSHYDLAGFAVGEVTPANLITGQAVRPGQTVIGLASSGIHSNGLSLARKVLHNEADLVALLTPTRIYVQPVLNILAQYGPAITGICHITGGGWRNLLRLTPDVGFDITTPLPRPAIFDALLAAGVSPEEAFKTFNMGMGMALLVSAQAEAIVAMFEASGVPAQIVGSVTAESATVRLTTHSVVLK